MVSPVVEPLVVLGVPKLVIPVVVPLVVLGVGEVLDGLVVEPLVVLSVTAIVGFFSQMFYAFFFWETLEVVAQHILHLSII
jgi:hypothetical protein